MRKRYNVSTNEADIIPAQSTSAYINGSTPIHIGKRIACLLLFSSAIFAQLAGAGSIWTVATGTLQSGATANGNGTALAVQGLSSVALTLNCSVACSGGTTITFQVSQDGTNYSSLSALQAGTTTIAQTVVNQGTTPTVWIADVRGAQLIRAPISAYSAGTITVTATAVAGPGSSTAINVANTPAVTQSSGPWTQNLTQIGGTTLGAPSNYGTSPGAVEVPGVNAYITNTPAVSQSGNWTSRTVGNGGATIDSAPHATAPTDVLAFGAAAVSAEQTAATNGQAQRVVTDLVGKLIALPYANPENFVSGTNSATGTGSTSIIAAEGASVRTYVTSCQITNTSATNSSVSIEDGSTVLTVIAAPANGGAVVQFPTPLKGSANTALNSVAGTAATTIYVSCAGYTGQ
jgi:hypothetical protein